MGGILHQPHPGARIHCCRCSLPGLTGFTISRRESANAGHHSPAIVMPALLTRKPLYPLDE